MNDAHVVCARSAILYMLVVGLLLVACGGQRVSQLDALDEGDAVSGPRPALQMYLVLTHDVDAMQTPQSVEDMWTAVRGDAPEFTFIKNALNGVRLPKDYKVDVELDFARLPHTMLPIQRLLPLLKTLTPDDQAKARSAPLAVSVRSESKTLPRDAHIHLVGAAVLRIAERYNGVVIDLLARRAFSASAWRSELAGSSLSRVQYRWAQRRLSDGRFQLLSRGNVKFGVPDLVVGPFLPRERAKAQAIFRRAHAALLLSGGQEGQTIILGGQELVYRGCASGKFDGAIR